MYILPLPDPTFKWYGSLWFGSWYPLTFNLNEDQETSDVFKFNPIETHILEAVATSITYVLPHLMYASKKTLTKLELPYPCQS